MFNINAEVYPSVIDFTVPSIEDKSIARPGQQLTINIDSPENVKQIELWADEQLVHSFVNPPFTITLNNDLLSSGQHQLKIVSTNLEDHSSTEYKKIVYLDGEPVSLIVTIDNNTDDLLNSMLDKAGINAIATNFLVPLSTEDFAFVHLNFGATNGPWIDNGGGSKTSYGIARSATVNEIENIQTYLDQGGSLILEGESVLNLTPDLQNIFGTSIIHKAINITSIVGESVYDDININITPDQTATPIYSDIIQSSTEGDVTNILTTSGQYYDWDAGQWLDATGVCSLSKTIGELEAKTIISSCLTRSLDKYSKGVVYNNYLNFIGISERLSLNNAPQIDAGEDIVIDERSVVTLSATATDEDTDDTLTISWLQQSGVTVSLDGISTLTPTFTAPEVTETQLLVFELTVTDGKDTITDTVEITVNHVNRAPNVSAGNNQTVVEGSTVNLSASISDEDEDTLSYSWLQTGGTTVTLSNTDTLSPSFVAPEVSANTTFTFELTVTDGVDSASSSVSITIQNKVAEKPKSESSSSGGSTNMFLLCCLLVVSFLRKRIFK